MTAESIALLIVLSATLVALACWREEEGEL